MSRSMPWPPHPLRPWLLALAALTALRLLAAATLPLSGDEAYYWTWSHALAPGYLDHPPMVALWMRVGAWLAGEDALGLRLLGPLSAAAGSVLLARAAGLLDMMLGRLLHLAGPGTTVLVVSAGTWQGRGGFLVAAGPAIAGSTSGVARLVDVAPTVLARFGLRTPTAGTAIPALAGGGSILADIKVCRPAFAADTRLEDGYPDTLDGEQAAALAALRPSTYSTGRFR